MAKRMAIDASVIVRFLTGDEKNQSQSAAELFKAAELGRVSLVVPTCTVQETVYVLESIYGHTADTIAPKLVSLLSLPNVENPDASWLFEALTWYRQKNSDFGDALLCAYAKHFGCQVSTFDKGLIKKFPEISPATPVDVLRD